MPGGNKIAREAMRASDEAIMQSRIMGAGPHARFCLWSVTRFIREFLPSLKWALFTIIALNKILSHVSFVLVHIPYFIIICNVAVYFHAAHNDTSRYCYCININFTSFLLWYATDLIIHLLVPRPISSYTTTKVCVVKAIPNKLFRRYYYFIPGL